MVGVVRQEGAVAPVLERGRPHPQLEVDDPQSVGMDVYSEWGKGQGRDRGNVAGGLLAGRERTVANYGGGGGLVWFGHRMLKGAGGYRRRGWGTNH